MRRFYTAQGFGPDYRLPGLSHRTGHGIGMDGHEPVNLVRGEATPLAPGMCFSNEPGLYLPGRFGIRLEDCFHMTEGRAGVVLQTAAVYRSPDRLSVTLEEQGYALWSSRLDDGERIELAALFDGWPAGRPGQRIDAGRVMQLAGVRRLIADQAPAMRPVRAVLFDKSDDANWALAWHQDRTIEVVERRDVEGFGPWTVKQGRVHVAPPVALLERMMTVRSISIRSMPIMRLCCRAGLASAGPDIRRCNRGRGGPAGRGDVPGGGGFGLALSHAYPSWLCPVEPGRHRRVLQIDLSADDLPGGLSWAVDG